MPTVIYNDTCPICSREVAAYARAATRAGADLDFQGLDAAPSHGLSRDVAARRFHVVSDGRTVGGVEAFAEVWRRLPRWRWIAALVRLPIVEPLARFGYDRLAAPALYALHRRRVRRQAARR
jgi:predicted DCC family thiol-disulfide oxidoreductase YuxK